MNRKETLEEIHLLETTGQDKNDEFSNLNKAEKLRCFVKNGFKREEKKLI